MDNDRFTAEITVTYRVSVDTADWATAFGLDVRDRDALGKDVTGWLDSTAVDAVGPASDVTATVTAKIVTAAREVPAVERLTAEQAEEQRGCWLDSSRGWTSAGHLVTIASKHGMPLSEDDRMIVDVYLKGDWPAMLEQLTLPSGEEISMSDVGCYVVDQGELRDKAGAWLNEHVAPDGWYFGWHDSEFYLLRESEWEKMNG